MPNETPIHFPNYQPPRQGIPVMDDPRQARMMSKMIRVGLKLPRRGSQSPSATGKSVNLPKSHRYSRRKDLH